MQSLNEQMIQCPYCGESISVLIDPSEVDMAYIEDCQVCCRPIEFSVVADIEGDCSVVVRADHE